MKRTVLSRYWLFQTGGWAAYALINLFSAGVLGVLSGAIAWRLLFFIEAGIFFSHLMREAIHRSGILRKPLRRQIYHFILFTGVCSVLMALVQTPFEHLCGLRINEEGEPLPLHQLFVTNFAQAVLALFLWNVIYIVYHQVKKSRRQEMDTLQLEALVKALELRTIKARINPHFIFNALNSIRALIDEDPARARAAVTELSSILRSSLAAEKGETVPLGEELRIVKDYLALEHMRFEDRLRIEYAVDEATLVRQVPPMMLQTLVENAIKHGISREVKGGMVKITSGMEAGYHRLSVQNTGSFTGAGTGGFGLSGTTDRLALLYGNKARFEIKQLTDRLVEATVLLPGK